MKLSKTYTDIETGHIIEKISEHLFYNKELKRVIITRLPLFDEENDLPTNNEYPYGQTDFLYLKATELSGKRLDKEKQVMLTKFSKILTEYSKHLDNELKKNKQRQKQVDDLFRPFVKVK